MRKLLKPLVACLAVLLLTGTSQVITRGYIYSNIGTLYTWAGTAQAWSGSLQAATEADFCTFIQNNGCAGKSNLRDITSVQAAAWAVNSSSHSPILTNNTFSPTCTAWSLAAGASFGVAPTCPTSGDADSDGYYSLFTTASGTSCDASITTHCNGTTSQTFSIPGTPTSQTVSLWYKGSVATASGDVTNCNPTTGSVGLSLKINSTTISLPTLTFNNAWHSTGNISTTALVNGSNTITLSETGQTTMNQTSRIVSGNPVCNPATYTTNTLGVDEVVLTATY